MVNAVPCGAQPLSILVVDDDEPVSTLLNQWGCEVKHCRNGAVALATANLHLPEVVLLDIGMPTTDWYEVARQLRQQPETEDALLIALARDSDWNSIRRSLDAGFDLHLTKPVPLQYLHYLLDQVRSSRAAVRARAADLVKDSKVLVARAQVVLAASTARLRDRT